MLASRATLGARPFDLKLGDLPDIFGEMIESLF